MEILKVSSKSNPNSVAGAIAATIKEESRIYVQAIGAGAINQAIKAIVIARGFVAPQGFNLIAIPSFVTLDFEEEGEKTGIRFIVEDR